MLHCIFRWLYLCCILHKARHLILRSWQYTPNLTGWTQIHVDLLLAPQKKKKLKAKKNLPLLSSRTTIPHVNTNILVFFRNINKEIMLLNLKRQIVKAALVAPSSSGVAASLQALTAVAACTVVAHQLHQTEAFLYHDADQEYPPIGEVGRTFLRALIVPSLLEEVIWRVALQPRGTSLTHMIGVNLAFTIYHIFGSVFLAEHLDNRQGAKTVFRDPAFLSLAFVLGNACSWSFVHSSYSLWAPVVTHAIPVTIWLSFLHGDEALSTPGGLKKSQSLGE